MATLLMANSCIAAVCADGKVARTPLPMSIPKPAARRSCMQAQERSSLRGLTRTDRGFRVPPCPVGSKKSSATSAFVDHAAHPGPRGSHVHNPGTGRTDGSFVFKKAHDSWMRDCSLPPHAASDRLCRGRSEPARRVGSCGRPFQRSSTQRWEKRPEKPPTWSGGITRCDSVWPVLCA